MTPLPCIGEHQWPLTIRQTENLGVAVAIVCAIYDPFTHHPTGSPQKTDRTSPSNDPLTPSLKLPACPSGSILDVGRKLSGIPSLKAGATPAKPKDSGPSKGAGPVSRDGGVGIFCLQKTHREIDKKMDGLIWKLVDVPPKKCKILQIAVEYKKGVWGVQRPLFASRGI